MQLALPQTPLSPLLPLPQLTLLLPQLTLPMPLAC
jgi:hypothetical protein